MGIIRAHREHQERARADNRAHITLHEAEERTRRLLEEVDKLGARLDDPYISEGARFLAVEHLARYWTVLKRRTAGHRVIDMGPMPSDGHLRLTEAAARMGISPRTLRRRCIADEVPGARREGGLWLIDVRALLRASERKDRYEASYEEKPSSPRLRRHFGSFAASVQVHEGSRNRPSRPGSAALNRGGSEGRRQQPQAPTPTTDRRARWFALLLRKAPHRHRQIRDDLERLRAQIGSANASDEARRRAAGRIAAYWNVHVQSEAPTMPRGWLTLSQAAHRLGVSPRTLRRRCACGEMPGARRDGARWFIKASAVKRALASTTVA